MFHNYFFIKRLAGALDRKLCRLNIHACFSQNKNELILSFAENEGSEFLIRANLDPNISILEFPDHFARAGRNSVDLFPDIIGLEVTKVETFQFERSFRICLGKSLALIFKLHGRRSNIILSKNETVVTIFRKSLVQDYDLTPKDLHKSIRISEDHFFEMNADPVAFIPALGKEVKLQLEAEGFYKKTSQDKWDHLSKTLKKLDENSIYLHETNSPSISLIRPTSLVTTDPIKAANWLYAKRTRIVYFEKEKEGLKSKLMQKIKKSERYIEKTTQKLTEVQEARNPEEIANILMANIHHIQKGLSKIVLTDFYTSHPITIKLNPQLSPQKNAENLYRKSKNRNLEIESLNSNIQNKEQLIDELSRQILSLEEVGSHKELRLFKKQFGIDVQIQVQPEHLPYHKFDMDGWQILVGKNSKSNDELTLKIAKKNDLWLHAKDVPGSHVVVKEKPGHKYPSYIIEYAASMAAANSKRKNDTLCPVIYTQKKYVRKTKGAPAGQVIVEKEEIVMVEPHL